MCAEKEWHVLAFNTLGIQLPGILVFLLLFFLLFFPYAFYTNGVTNYRNSSSILIEIKPFIVLDHLIGVGGVRMGWVCMVHNAMHVVVGELKKRLQPTHRDLLPRRLFHLDNGRVKKKKKKERKGKREPKDD